MQSGRAPGRDKLRLLVARQRTYVLPSRLSFLVCYVGFVPPQSMRRRNNSDLHLRLPG